MISIAKNVWYTIESELFRHDLGDEVRLKFEFQHVLIPAYTNIQATIKCVGKLKFPKFESNSTPFHEYPFTKENLHSYENNIYTFRTRYSNDLTKVLSLDQIGRLPVEITSLYVSKISDRMIKLADELTNDEKDTIKVMRTFFDFVKNHIKPLGKTTGKPVETLLDEYQSNGYFFGNCKEARDFYAALCNSKKLPVRKIEGKDPYQSGAHVWDEVCVPTIDGYLWVPVDCKWRYFNELGLEHYFLSHTLSLTPLSKINNWITKKPNYFDLRIDALN